MKIILETNALYAYKDLLEINNCKNQKIKLEEFRRLLSDPGNEIYTSSVSIYEYLIHYKDDYDEIQKFLRFIKKNINDIYQNDYFIFSLAQIDYMASLPYSEINNEIENLINKRIDVEARFSTLFLIFLIQLYLYSFIDKRNFVNQDLMATYANYIKSNQDKIIKEFTTTLNEGYKNSKAEKYLIDKFNGTLLFEIKALRSFIEALRKSVSIELDDKVLWQEFEKIIGNNSDILLMDQPKNAEMINKYIAGYGFNSESKITPYLFLLCQYIVVMREKGIPEIQIKYMEWIMSKLGEKKRGINISKFKKNDILDMLIATVLGNDDYILITFDENMQNFIRSINHRSMQYIEKVYSL